MTSAAELIFLLLTREAPVIARTPRLETQWRAEIDAGTALDARVTSTAFLVSSDVDAAILDAVRWYEARLASHPKDGDCHLVLVSRKPQLWKTVCSAIGPMQVQLVALRALEGSVEAEDVGLVSSPSPSHVPGPTGHYVEADLRDPEFGVRAGYAGLLRWKRICGGSPARWLTAWGWGKCPPARTIDHEAVRRCTLVGILLDAQGKRPEGWKCGHEGRKIKDEHDARLLAWAREKVKEEKQQEQRGGLAPSLTAPGGPAVGGTGFAAGDESRKGTEP